MSAPRILYLATRIAANTTAISDYLTANNLPQPSFAVDAPQGRLIPEDAPEMEKLRRAVIADTEELHQLMLGPREYLLSAGSLQNILLPHQAITRFNLARNLPIDKETTFAEMAATTQTQSKSSSISSKDSGGAGLSEANVRKLVRYAVANRIFEEPRPGVVRHNAVSRLLVEDEGLHDYVATCADELWQASAQTCNALEQFGNSEEPNETGFSLANNTTKSIHAVLAEHPARATRFANMMRSMTDNPAFDLKFVTDYYPWEEHAGGVVVDVGGSQGFVSIALARAYPSLHFIVQDLPSVIPSSSSASFLPADVASRITFQPHDFLSPTTPQPPTNSASVYLFRWIFHNWSDTYAVRILRNLVPGLSKGARIVVCDGLLLSPPPLSSSSLSDEERRMDGNAKGTEDENGNEKADANRIPPEQDRIRGFDLVMTTIQNAKERDIDDWTALFARADQRFAIVKVVEPPGSGLALLVVEWTG